MFVIVEFEVMQMNTMYVLKDLMDITQLSERTLRRYLEQGLLQGTKVGGSWRFSEDDVKRFIDSQKFSKEIATQASDDVKRFIRREYDTDTHRGCVILDFNEPDDALLKEIREIVMKTSMQFKGFKMKMFPEENYVRVVLIGGFDYIEHVTNALTNLKKAKK